MTKPALYSEYHEFNIDMDDDRNAEDLPRGNTGADGGRGHFTPPPCYIQENNEKKKENY